MRSDSIPLYFEWKSFSATFFTTYYLLVLLDHNSGDNHCGMLPKRVRENWKHVGEASIRFLQCDSRQNNNGTLKRMKGVIMAKKQDLVIWKELNDIEIEIASYLINSDDSIFELLE